MPIRFDIETLRKQHKCINYFETGLFNPRHDVSSKKALRCKFKKVFCIEIRKDWVKAGKKVFEKEIKAGRYNLYLDDSVNMEKYLTSNDFQNKTMFFLDAHVDNKDIPNTYQKKLPLFEELSAISNLERKDNIILIDDLRILKHKSPWGEESYGNINFLEQIKKQILSINENYKFSTLDGTVPDDVLVAYI